MKSQNQKTKNESYQKTKNTPPMSKEVIMQRRAEKRQRHDMRERIERMLEDEEYGVRRWG